VIRDVSGNGLHATVPLAWNSAKVVGPYGDGVLFDGAAGHLATTPTLALNPTAGTIAVVFDPATIATTSYLVSNSTSGVQSLSISSLTNNRIRFVVGAAASTQFVDSPIYGTDWFATWHTVVARYGPSGQFLWVDGVMVTSKPATTFTPPANDYLTFGGRLGTSSTYTIDSVFVHGRELADSEILKWSADPFWAFRKPALPSLLFLGAINPDGKPWLYRPTNHLIGAY
jgi:hypothetical protein